MYNIDYYDKGHISKMLHFSKFADSQRTKDIMEEITDRDISERREPFLLKLTTNNSKLKKSIKQNSV